jgi:sec-independent protein translocase protein TatB
MNFFGVGPLELLAIAIIAVIVLGPQRFPEAAVQVARAIRWLRGYANDATRDLREEFAELTKEYEEMRKELAEVRSSVTKSVGTLTEEMDRVAKEAKPALEAADVNKLLADTRPIVEPGGELPPPDAPASTNGSQP